MHWRGTPYYSIKGNHNRADYGPLISGASPIMEVLLTSNVCDSDTSEIAQYLHEPFTMIGQKLSGHYGGIMEHLWIDFELLRRNESLRTSWPFRFQKRVSGRNRLTGIDGPDHYNVGHYSVGPDFDHLLAIPLEQTIGYALTLIHSSTLLLHAKSRTLGGFNVELFRDTFTAACTSQGYLLNLTARAV